MEDTSLSYVPLDYHEAKGRYQLLSYNNGEINISWNNQIGQISCSDFKFNASIDRISFPATAEVFSAGESNKGLGHFSLNGFNYYFYLIKEADEIVIQLPIFRSDRRVSERILLYPTHNSFVHFKSEASNPNVIFLHGNQQKSSKVAADVNLRVLDLNDKAIAVLADEVEKNTLEEIQKFETVKMSIDGSAYSIFDVEYFYSVAYLERRFPSKQMYKVGFRYSKSDNALVDFISSKLPEGLYSDEWNLSKDFARFKEATKNEN